MTRRFPDDRPREQVEASPEFTRLLFVGFGVAGLIGLVCGIVWVAYNLLWLHGTR
jgi:hypothetical protein